MLNVTEISKSEVCKVFKKACSFLRFQMSSSTHYCTDHEIALYLGISPVTFSRCITGVTCPSGELLLKCLFSLQRNNDILESVNCII